MLRRNDYAKKTYQARGRRGKSAVSLWARRRILQAVGVALLMVALVNVGFSLAHSSITAVEVRGTRMTDVARVVALIERQLAQKRWSMLPQRVGLFFDVNGLQKILKSEFPFASWTIARRAASLSVSVQEREPVLIWVTRGESFYVDGDGVAFAPVRPNQTESVARGKAELIRYQAVASNLPVVTDDQGQTIRIGDRPLRPGMVNFVLDLVTAFADGSLRTATEVIGYRIDVATARFVVETAAGYQVYFTTANPLDEQLSKLQVALDQGVGGNKNVRYIDVRFGQKVFYQDAPP